MIYAGLIILGLFLLFIGGDKLVDGSVALAKKMNVEPAVNNCCIWYISP